MDPETNGNGVRLTLDQVRKLAQTMNNAHADEVNLSYGADGRLIVKQVIKTEKFKSLPLSK
jgi:hypothetical protein